MMSLSSGLSTVSILCSVALVLACLPDVYAGKLFPWHPVLMGLGFLGFMCEGVIAAYRLRPQEGAPRVAALQNHMWVQTAALASILVGFWAIYYNKNLNNKQHFVSLHGKMGVITFTMSFVAPTLGILSFKKLGALSRLPPEWQPLVKWTHRMVGAVTMVLALTTMQLAVPHKAVFQGIVCRIWQLALLMLGVGMIVMLRRPAPGKAILPQTDFTAVPQGPKHL